MQAICFNISPYVLGRLQTTSICWKQLVSSKDILLAFGWTIERIGELCGLWISVQESSWKGEITPIVWIPLCSALPSLFALKALTQPGTLQAGLGSGVPWKCTQYRARNYRAESLPSFNPYRPTCKYLVIAISKNPCNCVTKVPFALSNAVRANRLMDNTSKAFNKLGLS